MPTKRDNDGARTEEMIAYSLSIMTGAIPVSIAVYRGGALGGEATIGAMLIVVGVLGFLTTMFAQRSR
jgi:hypothetical protein